MLLLAPAVCLASGAAPWSCPPGTKLEKRPHSSEPTQVELCRDPETGFREGPYRESDRNGRVLTEANYRADKLNGELRHYDDTGQLTFVVQYSNGDQLTTRMTRAGMELVIAELNSRARNKGESFRWAVRDEHTVEIVTPLRMPAGSKPDEQALKQRLMADPPSCSVFRGSTNVQVLVARYVDDSGKDLVSIPIPRSACVK